MAHSMRAVAKNKNDELYTPPILVKPLIKHLIFWTSRFFVPSSSVPKPVLLLPFDTEKSEYVRELSSYSFWEIKYGHIDTGQDFFTHDYGHYDLLVSNPPFSLKKIIFEKLLKEDKPFALLCNAMCINYQEIGSLFADYPIQILGFDKRVSFDGNPSSFMSVYFCNKFLAHSLLFEHLEHNNTKQYFTASSMLKN